MDDVKTDRQKSIFISVNDSNERGHGLDLRYSLKFALKDLPHVIFQDKPKKPEQIFSSTVESILLCDLAILDACQTYDENFLDIGIQFGICYALDKELIYLYVDQNSQRYPIINSSSINEQIYRVDQYLHIPVKIKSLVLSWFEDTTSVRKSRFERKPPAEKIYSILGVDKERHKDLYNTIQTFSVGSDWEAFFYEEIEFKFKLDSIMSSILKPHFIIFYLSPESNIETYIAVGMAIGIGVPFLILQEKSAKLPNSLRGYDGIIAYENYVELEKSLKKHSKTFLSNKVCEWDGATYYHLMKRIEKQITNIRNDKDFDEIENLLIAINNCVNPQIAESYILLGDLYREIGFKIDPSRTIFLYKAKNNYEKASQIQPTNKRSKDSIAAVDKEIQFVELVGEGKYRDIQSLISLLGEKLQSEHYVRIRYLLIDEVKRLIINEEYLPAISLLAAIQIHDKSEIISQLINQIFSKTPESVLLALQDAQNQIELLENEKLLLVKDVYDRNQKIDGLQSEFDIIQDQLLAEQQNYEGVMDENKLLSEKVLKLVEEISELQGKLAKLHEQLMTANKMNEDLESERNNYRTRLNHINYQLASLKQEKDELQQYQNDAQGRSENIRKNFEETRQNFETARVSGSRAIIVNFGFGWATYTPLSGRPTIVRDNLRIEAYEGFVVKDWDTVNDPDGHGETFINNRENT